MPTPMHGQIGAAVFDGRIHVAGGAVIDGADSGTVLHQVYTPEVPCNWARAAPEAGANWSYTAIV
jgi:hypothetical protein